MPLPPWTLQGCAVDGVLWSDSKIRIIIISLHAAHATMMRGVGSDSPLPHGLFDVIHWRYDLCLSRPPTLESEECKRLVTVLPAGPTFLDAKRYAMRQPCSQLSDPRASDDDVLIPEDIAAVCGVKNLVSIYSRVARLLTRGRLLLCSVGGPSTVDFALVARLRPVPSSATWLWAFDNAPNVEMDSPPLIRYTYWAELGIFVGARVR